MQQIIINADDFGWKASVNQAIVEAFDRGWINSTTIMANMPGFEHAVELAHKHRLQHKIGVHLVITEGQPLTGIVRDMPFLFNGKRHLKNLFLLDKTQRALVYQEMAAQIERVRACGLPITHLDTHHQIHDVWSIAQIMIRLLRAYEIPAMRILNNLEKLSLPKNWYRNAVNRYLVAKGVHHTRFFGSRVDYLNQLKRDASLLQTGEQIEIMVHPDYNEDGDLIDRLNGKTYSLDFLTIDTNNSPVINTAIT